VDAVAEKESPMSVRPRKLPGTIFFFIVLGAAVFSALPCAATTDDEEPPPTKVGSQLDPNGWH
jgi:hypothetical protein